MWTAIINASRGREIGNIRPVLFVQANEPMDAEMSMVVVEKSLRVVLGMY